MSGWTDTFNNILNQWVNVGQQVTRLVSDQQFYENELVRTAFDGRSRHERDTELGRTHR